MKCKWLNQLSNTLYSFIFVKTQFITLFTHGLLCLCIWACYKLLQYDLEIVLLKVFVNLFLLLLFSHTVYKVKG